MDRSETQNRNRSSDKPTKVENDSQFVYKRQKDFAILDIRVEDIKREVIELMSGNEELKPFCEGNSILANNQSLKIENLIEEKQSFQIFRVKPLITEDVTEDLMQTFQTLQTLRNENSELITENQRLVNELNAARSLSDTLNDSNYQIRQSLIRAMSEVKGLKKFTLKLMNLVTKHDQRMEAMNKFYRKQVVHFENQTKHFGNTAKLNVKIFYNLFFTLNGILFDSD